jgi:hypothetical protein
MQRHALRVGPYQLTIESRREMQLGQFRLSVLRVVPGAVLLSVEIKLDSLYRKNAKK